jgi:hypothetical protein
MTSKKRQRAAPKASKTRRSRADGSRIKLAEAFLADLDRSWEQHWARGTRPRENRAAQGLFSSAPQAYGGSAPCA